MDWLQVVAIIGSLEAIIYSFGVFNFLSFNKLDTDIKGVGDRLDGWIKHSIAIQAEQSKSPQKHQKN